MQKEKTTNGAICEEYISYYHIVVICTTCCLNFSNHVCRMPASNLPFKHSEYGPFAWAESLLHT